MYPQLYSVANHRGTHIFRMEKFAWNFSCHKSFHSSFWLTMFWSNHDILVYSRILTDIRIILVTWNILQRYGKFFWHCWLPNEDSRVGFHSERNLSSKNNGTSFDYIAINKVHWSNKYSETQNFWNFFIWRGMDDAKAIIVSLYF